MADDAKSTHCTVMMFGDHYMKTEPFHTVYIHALVRDENGAVTMYAGRLPRVRGSGKV